MPESLNSPGSRVSRLRNIFTGVAKFRDRFRGGKNRIVEASPPSETLPVSEPELQREVERPGLVDSQGRLIFESPNSAVIDRLRSIDPRVEYFPFRFPGKTKDLKFKNGIKIEVQGEPQIPIPDSRTVIPPKYEENFLMYEFMNRIGIGPNLMEDFVIPYLSEQVRQDTSDYGLVGVRGTSCSINLDEDFKLYPERLVSPGSVKTIIDILNAGVENGEDFARMGGFDTETQDSLKHNYRTTQWIVSHTEGIRREVTELNGEEAAHSIFPVLLVYDRSKFPEKATTLPSDPEERKKVILKAYILDFPIAKPQ